MRSFSMQDRDYLVAVPHTAQKTKFTICVLGHFRITSSDGREIKVTSKKIRLLFAILACQKNLRLERPLLAKIIWSRHAEENALTSLRQALVKVKSILGEDYGDIFDVDRNSVGLNPLNVHSDIGEIFSTSRIDDGNQANLIALWQGKAFEDLELKELGVNEWIHGIRCNLAQHVCMLLHERTSGLDNSFQNRAEVKLLQREKDRFDRLYRLESVKRVLSKEKKPVPKQSAIPAAQPEALGKKQDGFFFRDPMDDIVVERYRIYLREKVRTFWINGVLTHTSGRHNLINLRMSVEPELIDAPYEFTTGLQIKQGRESGIYSDSILDLYVEHFGKLLVTGEPGSGKSTLLLNLVDKILAATGDVTDSAVPVVFNASTWNGEYANLTDWFVDELDQRYDIPKKIGAQLLQTNRLLLFIDGFDEVFEKDRRPLIETVNHFFREFPFLPVSVFCREHEYRVTRDRLKLFSAVKIHPIEKDELQKYILRGQGEIDFLANIEEFSKDRESFFTTPLAVYMARVSFRQNSDQGGVIAKMSIDEMMQYYVDSMLNKTVEGDIYPRSKTLHYLTSLAKLMVGANRSVFYLENLSHSSFQSGRLAVLAELLPLAMITSLCVLITSVMGYIHTSSIAAVILPIVLGTLGVLILFFVGESGGSKLLPRASFSLTALKFNLRIKVASLLYGSLALGGFAWLIFGFLSGLIIGLGTLVIFIIYCCLDFDCPIAPKQNFGKTNEIVHRSLKTASVGFLVGGVVGVIADLILRGRIPFGTASLLFSTVSFFVMGGHAVLQHYVVRLLLVFSGSAPLDYAKFFNVCYKRNLLYKVGGGVIFPHRLLQVYLYEKDKKIKQYR